jgi:hypothetical protein
MSYDFHSTTDIKRTRKVHICEQCNRPISFGSPARHAAGKYEGDFYSMHMHVECDDAARAYADLNCLWEEDFPWFPHMDDSEHQHHAWLRANFPIVADRLGVEKGEVA